MEDKSWKALNATQKFALDSKGSEWRVISGISERGLSNPACASARSIVSSVIKPRAQARNDKLGKPK